MKIVTLLGLVAGVAGEVAPQVTNLNPKIGMVITIIGLVAAALGKGLLENKNQGRAAVALALAAVVPMTTACDPRTLRGVANRSNRVAGYIATAIDLKRELHASKAFDDDVNKVLTQALYDVNETCAEANGIVATTTDFNPRVRADLYRLVNKVSSSIDKLIGGDIIRIRDPSTRANVRRALLIVKTTVRALADRTPDQDDQPTMQTDERAGIDELFRLAAERYEANRSELEKDLNPTPTEGGASP